jgi:hypothetical protein
MGKSLNEKYEIPFLSEWEHKDGGVYIAFKIEHSFKHICNIPVVAYKKLLTKAEEKEWSKIGRLNFFVRTVPHFLESFTIIQE